MSERSKVTLEQLIEKVKKTEPFEVVEYAEDGIVVSPVKGIVKISPSDNELKKYLGEAKRRRPRGKPTDKQLRLLQGLVKKLVDNKIRFKVVFEGKDVILRFDLEHFIKISDKEVKIVGFQNEKEGVLELIYQDLAGHGRIVFLQPVR